MSRLDDELRMAFRREQPSVDFTDRVLERIARQPVPKLKWWQTLAALFQPPKLRWVAIGATAALLVAIGAAQYAKLHPAVIDDGGGKVAEAPKAEGGSNATGEAGLAKTPDAIHQSPAPKLEPKPHGNVERHVVAASNQKPNHIRPKDRVVNPDAEAAKEKVMLALHITSETLKDAQQAIRDDRYKPQR
jgi:hypothetical protein